MPLREIAMDTPIRNVFLRLFDYCREREWAGYDPYDALNSRLLERLGLFRSKKARLAATQALKRSPINLRPLLQIPPAQNPKGLALFLSALLKTPGVAPESGAWVEWFAERLIALRSKGAHYWCWGYSFPWQTRTVLVPRGAANLVCTTFVGQSLLDLHEAGRDLQYLSMAASAAEYLLADLYWTDGKGTAGFGYPLPEARNQVHNANFLAAALLARVARLTGEERFALPALEAARCSASRQKADGSWAYGETQTQQWIDNFHTGFNLCALRSIGQSLGTTEFEPAVREGLRFYREHFFRQDGAPRYFHNRTYPLDAHSAAQSIITLLELKDLDPDNVPLAEKVFAWTMRNLWDERGFFYYRALAVGTVRTPYMRWSEAWMLLALAAMLQQSGARETAAQERRGTAQVC